MKLIDTAVAHLMLMRVGTDGSSSQIDVKDWESKQIEQSIFEGSSTAVQTGVIPTLPWAQMITNADQGTVLTWEADTPAYCASGTYGFSACNTQVAAASTYGFATTVDTNVAYSGSTLTPIYPALQAQDGSFYGTDNNGNMISFSQSGNVIWSIPDDYPQIATADGGVIGASGVTYDSQGRANGQIAMPIYAWTGDAYQNDPGQAQQLASISPDVATSFWPGGNAQSPPGANASGTSTAYQSIDQTLYVRIFAPFYAFGPDPYAYTDGYIPLVKMCVDECFLGDNRTFTTKVDRGVVTSRINGIVTLRSPGVEPINPNAYSDLTTAIYRNPPFNTGTAHPTMITIHTRNNGLGLSLEGADPLVPLAPDIFETLEITSTVNTEQVCYSGTLIGDTFPDTEVFVVNSEGQATTLMTYATTSGANGGPWTLLNPIPTNLGSFSNTCVPK